MQKLVFFRHIPASVVLALVVVSSPAGAQVEAGITIGSFWPLGSGWRQEPTAAIPVGRRHIAAHMLGARVAWWGQHQFGLEGTVGFTPSAVAVSQSLSIRDVDARVLISSLRGTYKLGTVTDGKPGSGLTQWEFNLNAGGAIMSRSGPAWANTSGTTHPAIVFGAEIRNRLTRVAKVRVAAEDFVSWATFDRGLQTQTEGRMQHDLSLSLGMQFSLTGGEPRTK